MSCVSTNSVITGDERGYIQVWDTDAGTVQRVLTAHKDCSDLKVETKGPLVFLLTLQQTLTNRALVIL